MNAVIRVIIPIFILILFITVMTTGAIVKKPMGKQDDVMHFMKQLESDIMDEEWDEAADSLSAANKAWNKVVHRIQFSAERDEISTFHKALDRTKGFIKAKDQGGALAEIEEANYTWSELGK